MSGGATLAVALRRRAGLARRSRGVGDLDTRVGLVAAQEGTGDRRRQYEIYWQLLNIYFAYFIQSFQVTRKCLS